MASVLRNFLAQIIGRRKFWERWHGECLKHQNQRIQKSRSDKTNIEQVTAKVSKLFSTVSR
jgi:hypothetical protein